MLTHIDIDEKKIEKLIEITHLKTKKDIVDLALSELLKKEKRKEILKWKGSDAWEGDLKEMRSI